jgi:hypothetical protein
VEPVTRAVVLEFLEQLGERFAGRGSLYLLGGSALCLLGSPRTTADIDYTFEVTQGSTVDLNSSLAELPPRCNST